MCGEQGVVSTIFATQGLWTTVLHGTVMLVNNYYAFIVINENLICFYMFERAFTLFAVAMWSYISHGTV